MEKQTRRGFIKTTSISVAAAGTLATGLTALHLDEVAVAPVAKAATTTSTTSTISSSEPMIAYLRNAATGEVGILVGGRETIYHDPELVSRLMNAAGQ